MINLNIKTKLGVCAGSDFGKKLFSTIKRGATAELGVDFNNYPYVNLDVFWEHGEQVFYSNIEQFTYLFKLPNKKIISYKLFADPADPNTMDTAHFGIDFENNSLSFVLSSKETAELPLAPIDNPIKVEAVFKLDTDKLLYQEIDSVIIEPQLPVVVVDSLYSEAGLANNGGL